MQQDYFAWLAQFEKSLRSYPTGLHEYRSWTAVLNNSLFGSPEILTLHLFLLAVVTPGKTLGEKQAAMAASDRDMRDLRLAITQLTQVMQRIDRHPAGAIQYLVGILEAWGDGAVPALRAIPSVKEALVAYEAIVSMSARAAKTRALDPKRSQSRNLAALYLFLERKGCTVTYAGLAACLWAAASTVGSNWEPTKQAVEKRIRDYARRYPQDHSWLTKSVGDPRADAQVMAGFMPSPNSPPKKATEVHLIKN